MLRPVGRPPLGDPESIMVSSTQQTETIRKRKARKRCKSHPMAQKRRKTPIFPIHPEGYDALAPDAKPAAPPAEK